MNATYRGRVRTGCQACRKSKVRCDEQHPLCKRCSRRQTTCVYPKKNTAAAVPATSATADQATHTPSPSGESLTIRSGIRPAIWSVPPLPLGRCSAHSETLVEAADLHRAESVPTTDTPSTGNIRSPSVLSSLISENIRICTTIDLISASGGANKPSLAYFSETVESPFITPYDAANWVAFKDRVLESAPYSSAVATAALAVQECYKARKNHLSETRALSLYGTACNTFEETALDGDGTDKIDVAIMAAFVLSQFEMLLPQHASRGPLAKSDGSFITQLQAWSCNGHIHTLLSLRIATWLVISHAAARRSGNPGLLSGTVHHVLVSTCSRYSTLPPLETSLVAPLSDYVQSTLSGPLFAIYYQLQLLSTQVADLSHYHRSRTTGADQEEVSVLISSLRGHIEVLWKDRPTLLRRTADDLRAHLTSAVAEPLVLFATLCHLTYHTELIEIGRNLSESQRASTEAKAHMAKAREIISSSDCCVEHADRGRPYVHPAYLRTLFLYAIESFDEADTLWAVSRMREIKDPICYSEFFSTFAEGLTAEQRTKGRRVTTKWWCWQAFGVTPPYL